MKRKLEDRDNEDDFEPSKGTKKKVEKVSKKTEKIGKSGFDLSRMRKLNDHTINMKEGGVVVYWMWRDCRVEDNYALIYAVEIASKMKGIRVDK